MSQSYVVRVSAAVSETVNTKDKRTKSLVLTRIVPAEEQKEILKEKLLEKGWEEVEGSDGQIFQRKKDGVTETINLEKMTLEATVEKSKTLERKRSVSVRGDRYSAGEQRKKAQKKLEKEIAITKEEKQQAETNMQEEILETLDKTEEKRTKEITEVVREVYTESLKRKAGRLGSVTSIKEGQAGEDYELVIKITE